MSISVTCIEKTSGNTENQLTAISKLGWVEDGTGDSGRSTREEMYQWVKNGNRAYVKDSMGNTADLIAAVTEKGTKYVRTAADGTTTDNLLALPVCG